MSAVEELIARSNRLGADPRNTNYAGGNTSAKASETDPVTGQTTMDNGSAGIVIIMMLLSVVLYLAYFIWNFCIKQGKTGYTIGKGIMGIKLVKAETGQPIGGGMAFVRQLAHILDGIPCYIGYLWPLWDQRNQALHDKVVGTFVVRA